MRVLLVIIPSIINAFFALVMTYLFSWVADKGFGAPLSSKEMFFLWVFLFVMAPVIKEVNIGK